MPNLTMLTPGNSCNRLSSPITHGKQQNVAEEHSYHIMHISLWPAVQIWFKLGMQKQVWSYNNQIWHFQLMKIRDYDKAYTVTFQEHSSIVNKHVKNV